MFRQGGDLVENFVILFIGVIVIVLGVVIAFGHIEIIHSYNRARITEETRKPYGKVVGIGSVVLGVGVASDGFISLFVEEFPPVTVIIGSIVGVAIILCGQFKYNKGVF